MNNFLLFPIILPFFFGMILMFGQKKIAYQRVTALFGLFISIICAIALVLNVYEKGPQTVTFGNWPAPFGITMVSDMVSALLVLTTLVLTFFIVWYGFGLIGKEREQ